MLTIDASVWVNADSPSEPESVLSRAFLDQISAVQTPVIVPTLLRVEIAGAISRTRKDLALAREYSERLSAIPFIQWISLDFSLSQQASNLAADHGLRGADAVYAPVAVAYKYDLISLDHEHLIRLPAVLSVRTPAQWLAAKKAAT